MLYFFLRWLDITSQNEYIKWTSYYDFEQSSFYTKKKDEYECNQSSISCINQDYYYYLYGWSFPRTK